MKRIFLLKNESQKVFERIKEYDFLITHRLEACNFSRNGRLSLPNTMMILLNFAKRSVQCEVNHFFNGILGMETVTKQAFQKARDKISYTAFQELFEITVTDGLSVEDGKLWGGFRLLAVDGSTLKLENTEELRISFGQSSPVKNESYARISMVFDLLNTFVVDAQIAPYSVGERELAMNHIEKIGSYKTGQYILLMDRGYWKREMFEQVMQESHRFLIRVPSNAAKALKKSKGNSGCFPLQCGDSKYSLRYFRFQLESGETETLVTNLSHEEVADEQLGELYFMRWGIETKYHELKNLLLLDNFTGKSVLAVKQDFFATMLLSNLVAFAAYVGQSEIDSHPAKENAKYAYKTNCNSIISALREHMIAAVVAPLPFERNQHMQFIQHALSQNPIPIRDGRAFPRREGSHRFNLRKPKTVI